MTRRVLLRLWQWPKASRRHDCGYSTAGKGRSCRTGRRRAEDSILAVRTKYLGRKGLLTGLLRNISQVPVEEKPLFGKRCNEVKELLETKIEEALQQSDAG